ncbi:MAG: amidohydrolase [Pseudomonadales bacterium]|nr:amidohydrolase [Pseudomonadales bacterium]
MFFKGAISADSHIVEPPNCYVDYIEPKYRDIAPHIETKDNGQDIYVIKDLKTTVPMGFLAGAGMKPKERAQFAATTNFAGIRKGGWDPAARCIDMDVDGIAAEIIYASVGMILCTHPDAEYKQACMTAYNRWLEEFCGGASNRLFGLAQTAVLSVDSAIEDFKKAKSMGMVGMMMPGNPVHEDYDHADYDALWECATDLDLPICFHILTAKEGDLASAFSAQRGHPLNGFMRIIRAVQDVVGLLTLGGVFERHPKLKMVCAEGDAGWMPHYMYRMDHAANFNVEGGILKGLTKLPSEYIKSNVYMTFQDDWVAFETRNLMDTNQLIWANDYPHTDSTWPDSQALLAEHAQGLSMAERNAILRDNVAGVFNLPVSDMPMITEAA